MNCVCTNGDEMCTWHQRRFEQLLRQEIPRILDRWGEAQRHVSDLETVLRARDATIATLREQIAQLTDKPQLESRRVSPLEPVVTEMIERMRDQSHPKGSAQGRQLAALEAALAAHVDQGWSVSASAAETVTP